MFNVNDECADTIDAHKSELLKIRVRTGPGKPGKSWKFVSEKGYEPCKMSSYLQNSFLFFYQGVQPVQ